LSFRISSTVSLTTGYIYCYPIFVINTYLSSRSATGSAYLASDAVNKTHSYSSPIFWRNSSTCGRFST